MKDRVIQAYRKLAPSYEHEDDAYNAHYERPAMIKLLPVNLQDVRIMDAGCAAGWYTDYFLSHGAIPTAIDVTPEMIEATKRRTQEKADVFLLDLANELPFEEDCFDIILSSLTLHYLEDWEQTFSEFKRILRPGGRLLFSTHHPFMDQALSESKDYFQKELLVDHWKRGEHTIEVVFYRRSLQEIVNSTARFFTIDQIVEPQPTEKMKEIERAAYDYLMKNPHFLIISASKSN